MLQFVEAHSSQILIGNVLLVKEDVFCCSYIDCFVGLNDNAMQVRASTCPKAKSSSKCFFIWINNGFLLPLGGHYINYSYSSSVNISSILTLKTFAIFQANTNEGLYLPFSRFPIVSRRTPTLAASSSCFKLYFALNSFIRFLIILCPSALHPFRNKS